VGRQQAWAGCNFHIEDDNFVRISIDGDARSVAMIATCHLPLADCDLNLNHRWPMADDAMADCYS